MESEREIDRKTNIADIDTTVKNKFKWEWLATKDSNGEFFSNYVRKLNTSGVAICKWCDCRINYGSSGRKSFTSHSLSKKHQQKWKLLHNNQSLPAALSATRSAADGVTGSRPTHQVVPASVSCSGGGGGGGARASSETRPGSSQSNRGHTGHTCTLPYGAAENIHDAQACNQRTVETKPSVSFVDRKSHAEARTLSFAAEHTLPLTLVPHLIKYAQEMAQDSKTLNSLSMERTTAAYKLRDGIGAALHRRLVNDLRASKFSMNVDECMSSAHEKVFSVIVSYFSEEEKCTVFKHYMSIPMTVVNAETLHKCIISSFEKDGIPLSNLISVLSDSANYMRGKTSGFETRLRATCSHLLDIDGDVCHHVHNIVKSFCGYFNSQVESLDDDLFTDFKWSPDLREFLEEICTLLEMTCQVPKQRIPHRWLSVFDITLPNLNMMNALIVFYWAWMPPNDRDAYKVFVDNIVDPLSREARNAIKEIQSKLRVKKLTEDGKKRKQRIVEKIFYQKSKTSLFMGLYLDLLPLFKSFVLMFEQKEPMMHRLHDEQIDLVKTFLACFIKPECLKSLSAKQLADLDVTQSHIHLNVRLMYVGSKAEKTLKTLGQSTLREEFLQQVKCAYIATATYMLRKIPLENKLLQCLSAIDPKAQGHSVTFKSLVALQSYFPTVLTSEEEEHCYKEECRALQMNELLPDVQIDGKDRRADQWWAEIFATGSYPSLSSVVKACLSICTGPQVEQSFSLMNNIITRTSNRLDVQTYAAVMAIKYDLKAKGKTALQLYHREDTQKDPVDKGVAFYLQTAYSRYKRKLSSIQKEKEEKRTAMKVGKPLPPKKQQVHSMAASINKQINSEKRQLKRKRIPITNKNGQREKKRKRDH